MPTISTARQGVNALLDHLPNAEIASITNQNGIIRSKLREALHKTSGHQFTHNMDGPWTCVELYFHNGQTGEGEIKRYGIWNSTGSVYQISLQGDVDEDPIIQLPHDDDVSEPPSEISHIG